MRRRPVPAEFRDEHDLRLRSRAWGRGFRRTSRSIGYCRCGARFPYGQHADNLDAPAVRDEHKDHVERVYYGEATERDRKPEWKS